MNAGIELTIAIPFFNEERYLTTAIQSVLRQTLTAFELLLVDDGSHDASLHIARSLAHNDRRVKVVSDGERRGLPARLNQIAHLAHGALVARMDGDDISHPDRLRRQVAILNRDQEFSAVGTWAALIDENEKLFAMVESSVPASAKNVLKRGLLSHATMVARREWLLRNPYDERLTRAEDRDLWCRTAKTTRFAVIPEPLYVVRVRVREEQFLADYLLSQKQNRLLYRRYGPRLVGVGETISACVSSFAKGLVMRGAVGAGFADRLTARRGRAPTADEMLLVEEALAAVG